MAKISYGDAYQLLETLKVEHSQRHSEHKQLRDFWHGRHWDTTDSGATSLANLFRDFTSNPNDTGPDYKMVHNIVHMVCAKFQTFLSPLPMIRVYTDPPESEQRKAQATLKERALYSLWNDVRMSKVLNQVAWYLPLMGDCFLGVHPDIDRSIPLPVLRSPEYSYPVVGFDGMSLDTIMFEWEIRESVAKRSFPNYVPGQVKNSAMSRLLPSRGGDPDPKVKVMEYSDTKCLYRWVDGQQMSAVEHDYGWNLYEQLSFIHVPDEPWNHGAVEQTVGLNVMHDALMSLLFQAVLENVFPVTILEDPAKAPEYLERGPGAVWPLNAGGKAYTLTPPAGAIGVQAGFLEQSARNIQEASSMPPVNFGVSPASSIVTGAAVNELQGAGTGSMVEMVQGNGIGPGMSAWNSKALVMFQTLFRNDRVQLGGMIPQSGFDMKSRMTTVSFKGSEIVGSQRNEVVFSPAMEQHEKLVMWLQAKGGGLVSDKFVREQIGVPDNEAMVEEIIGETIEQAVVAGILNVLQQDPSEQNATQVEDRAFAYIQGQTNFTPGSPAIGAAPPTPGPPPAPGPAGAQPGPAGPPVPAGPGPPIPAGPPPMPAPAGPADGTVTPDQVAQAIAQVPVQGKVYLAGEIVQRGETTQDIEFFITVPDDQQTLTQALSQWRTRLVFHTIKGEPQEQFIDITPGQQGPPGGPPGGAPPPGAGGPPSGYPLPPQAGPAQQQPIVAGVTQ